MRKSLVTFALLGSLLGGGCLELTPQGRAVGQSLLIHAAKESISGKVNPRTTNVYNQGQGRESSNENGNLYIDSSLFKTPKDEKEAKSIYYILRMDKYYSKTHSKANYIKKMRAFDLEGCPEDFKEAYRKHLQSWESYLDVSNGENFLSIDSTWREVLDIAFKEGVIER